MGMINVICSALGMRALTKLLPLAPGLSNNDIVSDCVCCREQSLTKHGTENTCPLALPPGPCQCHCSRGQMSRSSPYSVLTQHKLKWTTTNSNDQQNGKAYIGMSVILNFSSCFLNARIYLLNIKATLCTFFKKFYFLPGSVLICPARSMLTVSARSDFSCSSNWF